MLCREIQFCNRIAFLAIVLAASLRRSLSAYCRFLGFLFWKYTCLSSCLFDRLVPEIFRLVWRLIRIWLCLASAWSICLKIVWARAVVAFPFLGTARAVLFLKLGVYEIMVPGMFLLACHLSRVRFLDSAWLIHLGIVRARAVVVFVV